MKTRVKLSFWAAVLSVPLCLNAQNSISGKISNSNQESLPGILVKLEKTYIASYTNVEGNYNLKNLSEGIYIINLSGIGYETLIDTIKLTDKNVEKNYALKTAIYLSEAVIISATRATAKTPTTFTNLTKENIQESNFGQDIPFILDATPSTVVSSDAGAGVGYTNISIRGVDGTRTNVTVNGIPMNDAESHGTYWVNMPDLASSVDNIQIQRGVGTSTNGAAAFGASINMQTNEFNDTAYAEIANSFGSFNTLKHTIKGGTGLINKKFTLDTRLSKISSDGFIDRASSNLKSFYVSGAYYGKKSVLRANVFSGKEITYQAWYGTPESRINGNDSAMNAFADRNYLSDTQRENLLKSGRKYNFYEYENEVDNYQQDHYQLHFTHEINKKINANISAHYTHGQGYYEQSIKNADMAAHHLNPVINGLDTITTTDLIRRRWLDNHFYGVVYSLNYNNLKGLNLSYGGAANNYEGRHFGEIIWARFASQSDIRDRYYDNYAQKMDINNYIKANYQIKKMNLFADVQFRHIDYQFYGWNVLNGDAFQTNRKENYNFLNPKAGFVYEIDNNNSVYASLSIANREPTRADFTESSPTSQPKAESLQDFELGYKFKSKKLFFNGNYYYMNYINQLVLTGKINDVGAYTRTNIDKSYRTGIELEGGFIANKYLQISANVTFSENKIPTFTEYVDDYDNGGQVEIVHSNSNIAFSPNIIAGGNITLKPLKNLSISLLPKYVGSQFMDNTSNTERKTDEYVVLNGRIQYSIQNVLFKEIKIGLLVNNITDTQFQNNGYTFSYIAGGATTTENFYYPQAGTNFLLNIVCKF